MKKFFKKKGIVLSVLMLMVAAAIFINWKYSDQINGVNTPSDAPGEIAAVNASSVSKTNLTEQQEYVLTAKKDRNKTVSDSISELKGIEDDASLDEETRNSAGKQRAQIYENSVKEASIEELVIAKGYKDCAAVINGEKITIIVIAEKLEASDTLQIIDIVKTQSEFKTENIKIMNI